MLTLVLDKFIKCVARALNFPNFYEKGLSSNAEWRWTVYHVRHVISMKKRNVMSAQKSKS